MSEHTLQHQSSLQSDTALQSIRSTKLRDFLSKKPSFLRSTTPDASYSSTHDFHKITPPYLDYFDNPDTIHAPKVASFTSREGLIANQRDEAIPHHKPTRSRSSSELEQMLQKFGEKDLLAEVNSLHGSTNSKKLFPKKGDNKGKQYGISSAADTNNSEPDEKRNSNVNRGRLRDRTSDAFGSTARTTERDSDHDTKYMVQGSKQDNYYKDQRNIPFKNDQFGNPIMIDSIQKTGNKNQKGFQQGTMRPGDNYEEELNEDDSMKDNSIDNIIDMMGPKKSDKNVQPQKDSAPSSSINLDDVPSSDPKDLPLDTWAKPASSFLAQQALNPAISVKQASSQKEYDLLGPPSQNNLGQYNATNDHRKGGNSIEDLLNQDFLGNPVAQQAGFAVPQGGYNQYDPNNLYANFGNNLYQQKQASPVKTPEGMPNQASTQMYSHSPSYPQMQPQSQASAKLVPLINIETLSQPKPLQNRQPTFDPTQLDYSSPAHTHNAALIASIPPIMTGRESLNDPMLAQYTNPKLGISFTSRADGIAQSSICRFHPANVVSYVCVKENCGELLCPLCLYEHQKNKHIGEYEAIPAFTVLIKQKLEQAQENLNSTLEQIKKYQTVMSDKSRFDLRIVEELSQIETNLVKNVRQFFDSIRQEFSKDIFFDFSKVSEDLTVLHQDLSTTVKSLTDDLSTISQDVQLPNPHILTHIVQKDYPKSALSSRKTVNVLEGRIKRFLDEGYEFNAEPKLNMEINPRLTSKLLVLLTEGVRIQDKPSKQTLKEISQVTSLDMLPQTTPQVRSENMITEPTFYQDQQGAKVKHGNTKDLSHEERKQDLVKNKISEKNRHEEEDSQQRPRTLSPWKGASNTVNIVRTINNAGNTTSNSLQQTQKGIKSHFDTKKLNEDITNRVLEMYNAGVAAGTSKYLGDKDVDIPMMKFLIGYMERYYSTSRIKVIDPTFFQKLLNTGDSIDFSDFGRKELFFENVVEELQAGLPKSKSVFTYCEKVFMLGKITTSQWFLVEIRSNPKAIILYDFLGKFQKSKFSENLFGLILEIIRKEYNSKLGQNPENYLWDKKVASYPTLIVKNPADTGVLGLKVISNCYQNKELTSGKVTLNEISLTRKKIDKILKMYEEKKNHDKFVHI